MLRCQTDKVWLWVSAWWGLEDTHLVRSVKTFSKRFNEMGRGTLNMTCSVLWVKDPEWIKKVSLASVLVSLCLLTVDAMWSNNSLSCCHAPHHDGLYHPTPSQSKPILPEVVLLKHFLTVTRKAPNTGTNSFMKDLLNTFTNAWYIITWWLVFKYEYKASENLKP